jgi:fatty acid desaturase
MNHHAEHHLFPYVPHCALPQLRKKVMSSDRYRGAIQWRPSYVGFILDFLRATPAKEEPRPAAAQTASLG